MMTIKSSLILLYMYRLFSKSNAPVVILKKWRNVQVGSQFLLVTFRDEKDTIYTVPFKRNI
ncbi:hypothetical protein [Lysinibacillus fusiformis]|uniref:hypothetical protein n=1 Tax=Lysinibacillus fusiformis TaxID=28031 RepID=UPI0011A1281F|nr:hypothetical protein [Lysinibacillus fusiformis]